MAIVGIGCRVPGAQGVTQLRERLAAPADPFVPLPPERWDAEVFAADLPDGRKPSDLGALLSDFDVDWRALKMPPLQLERMHRMEKLALGTMSEALADAGIRVGSGPFDHGQVFVAAPSLAPDPSTDHGRRIRRYELQAPVSEAVRARLPEQQPEIDEYIERLFNLAAPPVDPDSMLTSASLLAGRIANLFDFRGGHVAVDAGFSSSLAAVERAVAALATDACDVALVCAVSPLLTPSAILAFAHRNFLGSKRPRPFAADADGTLLGEGCLAVVLRRAGETAKARVYACIDGVGHVTPARRDAPECFVRATAEAVGAALEAAACKPEEIAFVETRAAGIREADQAEARGLKAALPRAGSELALRSAVPQFGFLQAASGMLALVRAALELEPSPKPRRAGVSDVGLNAPAYHAILSSPATPTSRTRPATVKYTDGIAIVGCGLLVPQANDPATFWRNLLANVDALGDLPSSRWDIDKIIGSSQELGAILRTRLAGVVSLPPFDPARFGIPPASARALDPAVILALLATEQALTEARFRPGRWNPKRVQVLFGQLPLRSIEVEAEKRVLFAEHLHLVADAMREAGVKDEIVRDVVAQARAAFDRDAPRFSPDTLRAFTGSTCALQVAAAWDFQGPAYSVDAACASSLAALRMGAESLLLNESDVVLAGGIAANLLPEYYIALGMLGFLSPDGAPPFGLKADGFVPAEGAGVVVLKRLEDALASRDNIYAVLRGVGFSSDGRDVAVYAPSTHGQQRAIRRALASAGVPAGAIDLLEAHGAGTQLGDRTEIESYAAVYGDRDGTQPLSLGTVKSQIGHLSSAAAIVGVIKAALALKEKMLPPSNADTQPGAELPFGRLPLELATEARPWAAPPGGVRRAAVSAFGLGGVNYHVVLEEHRSVADERRASAAAAHPAKLPARGTYADRFVVELAPVSLPARPPRFSLAGKHAVLVADPRERYSALADALAAKGARVTVLRAGEPLSAPDADVLIDLSLFTPDATLVEGTPADAAARIREHARRSFPLLQAVYPRFADAKPLETAYLAVTALGGGLGLLDGGGGHLGASLLGVAKGLKQELPQVIAKGIDFDPEEAPATIAEVVLRELEDGNDRMEVGWLGRRMVVNLRRDSFRDDTPVLRPLAAGDVFIFSGGGRGVAFECACALARLGVQVVVTGRTAPPDPSLPWLQLDDERFTAFRNEELTRQRAADPKLTPARFQERFEALQRQRELHRNLERAREQGLPVAYETCDITDAAQVAAMAARVRDKHGRIDGVAHAAMVEWSRSLPRKTPELIEKTLFTKALGLVNLLEATREDRLRVFACFGSGAGRFGNRGQIDYAGANALMAALLPARAAKLPHPPHVVTIDWTAWESVGAAVANPDIAALVKATGVTSIRPEEGVYWFLSELALGRATETVIFEERMLHQWPFLGARAEGAGDRALELDDRGEPLVAAQWPMVDYVLERRRGRVVFERRLDIARDPFLDQHRLYGTPIVPATFGVEILAEAAALSSPGWHLESADEIRIGVPVKLFHENPLLLRASARVTERGDRREVAVETRSHLFLKGKALQDRLHHTGRFVLRRGAPPVKKVDVPQPEGAVHARSFFHMARDPVALGPLFCRAEWIQVLDEEVIGTIRAPRQRDIFRDITRPILRAAPLIMDAAFQIAANWDGHRHHMVSIPLGLGKLIFGRPRQVSESARVHARVQRVADPDVFYDVVVAAENGDLLMEIRGLQLKRIAHLEKLE